ncbi:MAG: BrnT family toxin [Verrucomicrobiia bacterium]|tara:strand:+ start:11091 stop:11276 length:186 start_codon:yes stop_codon:yes gene_type:complete
MHQFGVLFDWDDAKAEINLSKHGISFETARELWADRKLIMLATKNPTESRYLAIGRTEQKS